MGVDVVADRELAHRDDALGLVPDVEEYLVVVDLHDRALHDVTLVEGDHRLVDGVVEREGPEVVLGDLVEGVAVGFGGRRGLGGGFHLARHDGLVDRGSFTGLVGEGLGHR